MDGVPHVLLCVHTDVPYRVHTVLPGTYFTVSNNTACTSTMYIGMYVLLLLCQGQVCVCASSLGFLAPRQQSTVA